MDTKKAARAAFLFGNNEVAYLLGDLLFTDFIQRLAVDA
jgi:hypothetical protein